MLVFFFTALDKPLGAITIPSINKPCETFLPEAEVTKSSNVNQRYCRAIQEDAIVSGPVILLQNYSWMNDNCWGYRLLKSAQNGQFLLWVYLYLCENVDFHINTLLCFIDAGHKCFTFWPIKFAHGYRNLTLAPAAEGFLVVCFAFLASLAALVTRMIEIRPMPHIPKTTQDRSPQTAEITPQLTRVIKHHYCICINTAKKTRLTIHCWIFTNTITAVPQENQCHSVFFTEPTLTTLNC